MTAARRTRQDGASPGGIPLMEEAVLLLRSAPAGDWAIYLLGGVPFAAGLLWLATDAIRNFFAPQHLVTHSLMAAGLFVWKQLLESLFLFRLHRSLSGTQYQAGAASLARALVRQAALQPTSLIALPFALVASLPAAWTIFFYRGFSLFAIEDPEHALARSARLARLFPSQAWVFLGVLTLAALLLYLNLLAGVLVIAQLATSLLGFDNLRAAPATLLSSGTVHLGIVLVVYLCVDVLLDAATALRCFYGESISSGADILASLRRMGAAAGLVLLAVAAGVPLAAQVDEKMLNQSIDRTLQQPEFAWRMPVHGAEPPVVVNWLASGMEWIGDVIGRIIRVIREWFRPKTKPPAEPEPGGGAPSSLRYWLWAMAAAAAGAVVLVNWRSAGYRRARRKPSPSSAEAAPADVRDEAVLADQQTEDGWLALADELIAAGEYRRALRAMHLAGLRLLAERELVTIRRWKSGLEYLGEVRRRARQQPRIGEAFALNLRLFDLGWYSYHAVEPPMLDDYRRRLQEIRSYAHS